MKIDDLAVMLEGLVEDINASQDARGIVPEAIKRFNKYLKIATDQLPEDNFLKELEEVGPVSGKSPGDYSIAKEKIRSRSSELKSYLKTKLKNKKIC